MGKNPPAGTGDVGSIPGLGGAQCHRETKSEHHTAKAHALEPVLHSKRSHRNEKPEHCGEEQPHLTPAQGNKD